MDNKANEVLSRRILWNCRRSNLSFLDSLAQDELDSVVTIFLCLDELWNLDLLCLEINLYSTWTLKTLMIVMLALELWKSALMSEESLECFVKMRYRRSHALDIDFFHPRIVFLELMILVWDAYAYPTKMLLELSIFLIVKVQCPIIDKTNSPKVLCQKHFLLFCRIEPELVCLNHLFLFTLVA